MVKLSRRKQQNPKSVVHSDAELAFKENTKSAENSDILAASSPRGSGTDKDNPGRSADESHDGPDDDRHGRRDEAGSRSTFARSVSVSSASSASSASVVSSINLVEEEEEDEEDEEEQTNDDEVNDDVDEDDEDPAPDDAGNVHRPVVNEDDGYDNETGENLVSAVARRPSAPAMPRLRLNVTLASDPALQPYARGIKPPDVETLSGSGSAVRPLGRGCDEPPPNVVSDDDEAAQSLLIDVRELVPPENLSTHMNPRSAEPPTLRPAASQVAAAVPPPKPPKCAAVEAAPSSGVVTAYSCDPCAIRFSSLSTLAAHQTYYCSHGRKAPPAPDDDNEGDAASRAAPAAMVRRRSACGGGQRGLFDVASIPPDAGSGPTTQTAPKDAPPEQSEHRSATGRLYACTQCSYSADKKVSLNRHMRMHQMSPASDGRTASKATVTSAHVAADAECYCSDCDIRYSSVKTYRAHKQHYCSARHRDDTVPDPSAAQPNADSVCASVSRSQSPRDSLASNALSLSPPSQLAAPQPYLALPTNPIVIIPYSLIRGASVLPGPMSSISPISIPNPDHTCFILCNGIMQPIAQSLALPPMMSPPNAVTPLPPCGGSDQPNNAAPSTPSPAPQMRPKSTASVASSTTSTSRRTPTASTSAVQQQQQQLLLQQFETGSECSDLGRDTDERQLRPESIVINATAAPLDLSVRHMPADLSARSRARTSQPSTSHPPHTHVEHIAYAPTRPSHSPHNLHHHYHHNPRAYTPQAAASPAPSTALSASSPAPSSLSAPSPAPPPVAVGCLYGSTHQQFMLRQLLPTDMMQRLVEAAPPPAQMPSYGTRRAPIAGRARRSTTVNSSAPVASVVSPHHLKQGVSKCKECNIVFCKYENYVAHKKHYCSARHQQPAVGPAAQPDVDATLGAADPSISVKSIGQQQHSHQQPPTAYQQVVCAACGIKFTSLDNLSAHQMYYCPKRSELLQPSVAPGKLSAVGHETTPTTPSTATSNKRSHSQSQSSHYGHHHQYRCPLCDVVSPNAGDAKRHLDTHAGVKAFRCSICRYRGNTMRGMRTHIRMHFDRKSASADFNEEDYITCVLEENGVEVVATQQQQQQQQKTAVKVHNCHECGYASAFAGNVMRHTKLVHGPMGPLQLPNGSPLVGEGGESLLFGGAIGPNAYSVNFRAERLTERHQQQQQQRPRPNDSTSLAVVQQAKPSELSAIEAHAKRIKLESMDDQDMSSAAQQQPMRRKSVVSVN